LGKRNSSNITCPSEKSTITARVKGFNSKALDDFSRINMVAKFFVSDGYSARYLYTATMEMSKTTDSILPQAPNFEAVQ
jgi:hypothetical protein